MKAETILFLPLAGLATIFATGAVMAAGMYEYDKFVDNRNTVTFNVSAKSKDGYDVSMQAKARAHGNSGSRFASDAEKTYTRTVSESEIRSAIGLLVLQDVANDACQYNGNDLSGTFLEEVNGASFSHLSDTYSFRGVTAISIPASEQQQLISHCTLAVKPPG